MAETTYKRMNSPSEAKERLKWLLIGQVIFWALWGIIILIVGDMDLALAANPEPGTMTEDHWVYKFWSTYSHTFEVILLGTLAATLVIMIVPKAKPYRRVMLQLIYTLAFSGIQVESMKRIVGRARPFETHPTRFETWGETTDSGSMPSGHVAYSGSGVWPHAIWAKKLIVSIIFALYGVGMMWVRMFLGVHYASDVLVGNIITVLSSFLSFLLFQRIYKNGSVSTKKEWLIFVVGILLFLGNMVVMTVFF